MTLETAREELAGFQKLAEGRKMPLMVDIREVLAIAREARVCFTGPEGEKTATAVALLTGSALTRVLGNFFMGLNKPSFPVRIFTSEAEALEWLRGFPQSPE